MRKTLAVKFYAGPTLDSGVEETFGFERCLVQTVVSPVPYAHIIVLTSQAGRNGDVSSITLARCLPACPLTSITVATICRLGGRALLIPGIGQSLAFFG